MAWYGGSGDFREFSPLEFFHDIFDASPSLVLINIDLGGREGLHGIGADISCNQGRYALLRYFLGRLYPCTAGCSYVGVGNGILDHAVQVNHYEKWASSKSGIHGGIEARCTCSNTYLH
jgi:hypothetical protein